MGIFDVFSGKRSREAAVAGMEAINSGKKAGFRDLGRGADAAKKSFDTASGMYKPLDDTFTKGVNLHADAMGLNGAAGSDRAAAAFQTGPGYEFTLDQGLKALERRRAAGGMLNSGNADVDAMTYATGLADQEYGDWRSALAGYNPLALTTTGARAGFEAAKGGIDYDVGKTKLGTRMNVAGQQAAMIKSAADAGDAAAANGFGAFMGGVNLLAQGVGGVMGMPTNGSTIGSKLFGKMFG